MGSKLSNYPIFLLISINLQYIVKMISCEISRVSLFKLFVGQNFSNGQTSGAARRPYTGHYR